MTTQNRTPWYLLVACLLLLTLAAGVRYATYDRYLPVIEDDDEMRRALNALHIRHDAPLAEDFGSALVALEGFPPGQLWAHAWVGRVLEQIQPFPFPSDYVHANRVLAATLSWITVVLLLGSGVMMGVELGRWGWAAGLAAGTVWAFSQYVVQVSTMGYADSLLYPFVAGGLLLAVVSIRHDNAPALMGSLLCVIIAIYIKYVLIYALVFPGGGVLVLMWRRRWRSWPVIALMAVVSGATAGYLIWGYGALSLDNRETAIFYESGLANALSPSRNWENLRYTLVQTLHPLWWVSGVAWGIWGYWLAQREGWRTLDLRWLWLLVPFIIGGFMLTSSVDVVSRQWQRLRYTFSPAIGLLVLWGLLVAQGIGTTAALGIRRGWHRSLTPTAGTLMLVLVAVPMLADQTFYAVRFAGTHTYVRIWTWADASLPDPAEGTILIPSASEVSHVWHRTWGGYNGATEFPYAYDANPAHQPPAEMAANNGVMYLAATEQDLATTYDTPKIRTWVDSLFYLKTIPPGVNQVYTTRFYRLLPPQNTTAVTFDETIQLVGYDLNTSVAAPGDVVILRPYWQATAQPGANYSMFVHLLAADNPVPLTQFDGSPATPARLTPTWTDPDETLIGTDALLVLPADVPPGDYTLALGLYDFQTGLRLQLANGADAYTIPLRVQS
jgi:hypothetical protein